MKSGVHRARRRALGSPVLAAFVAMTSCGDSPSDVVLDLPDGTYVVTTGSPRVVDQFVTPSWMRRAPTIELEKEGPDFFVTGSSDDMVVEGPPQLAQLEGTFWRLHLGWAEDEEDHYWEILFDADECIAAAVDADLGIPPTGSLTVVLEECAIQLP